MSVGLPAEAHRPVSLMGGWWAGGDDPRQLYPSPMFADLKGLPPTDISQGTDDIFIVDSRTFAERAAKEGADVHLYETPGGFHKFIVLPFLPESRDVYQQVAWSLARR